jgi:hypothetical protein
MIYEGHANTGDNTGAVSLAWTVVMTIIPTVLFSFVVFFINIERKHLSSFYNLQKGFTLLHVNYWWGSDDEHKCFLFECSRHYWVGIEDEMKLWVQENWAKWEEEKPEWLTDVRRAQIPVEFIPTAEHRQKESVRRASVRRPSMIESIVGGGLGSVMPAAEDEARSDG